MVQLGDGTQKPGVVFIKYCLRKIIMYFKIHKSESGNIVAACDRKLIEKVLTDGKKKIDLKKYRNFYAGKISTEKELANALGDCTSANLIGKKAVRVAMKVGLVKENEVMFIKGVPYIQIYRI